MKILTFVQIIVAVLLIVSVTLQSRGSQGGITFGGSGESYRSKRGLEKLLFYSTIVLAVLFGSVSLLALIIK